jgi:hypothetical protein
MRRLVRPRVSVSFGLESALILMTLNTVDIPGQMIENQAVGLLQSLNDPVLQQGGSCSGTDLCPLPFLLVLFYDPP